MRLTNGARRGKRGIATVWNPDGSFNREVHLTTEELAFVQGKCHGAPPKGVTPKEWDEGLATVTGYDVDVGDVDVRANGELFLLSEAYVDRGRTTYVALVFKPDEWSGVAPDVTVTPEALQTLPVSLRPASIVDGVLTK